MRIDVAPAVYWEPPLRPGPEERSVRIYALDPSLRQTAGQQSSVTIPYESLHQRMRGKRLHVGVNSGPFGSNGHKLLDLDDPSLAANWGRAPAASDPLFLQQMVYGVCSWTLRRFAFALGREPEYAFEGPLRLEPYAFEEENAYYDRERRALRFGWFRDGCGLCPGHGQTLTFTAAAHDIVIHEMSHALLDGLKPNLLLPTNPDVLAFHEGFSDLIAIFSRFTHSELLLRAICDSKGDVDGEALVSIGRQFGRHSERQGPLRTSILDRTDYEGEAPAQINYQNTMATHDRGSLLVSAVFEAFRTVYLRRTRTWRSVTGSIPALAEHPVLAQELARTAQKLAEQFLNILIRAIDYLPPVDVDFGDYLRAMITADHDLVPKDEWGYREDLVYAFKRYGIPVRDVLDLGEAALLWDQPTRGLNTDALKSLGRLPVSSLGPWGPSVRRMRAEIFRRFLRDNREGLGELGLVDPSSPVLPDQIAIESIRAIERTGPDGQLMVCYVAEVLAWQWLKDIGWHPGGATLIVDVNGELRYVIHKRLRSRERRERTRLYRSGLGLRYSAITQDAPTPAQVPARAAAMLSALHRRCC